MHPGQAEIDVSAERSRVEAVEKWHRRRQGRLEVGLTAERARPRDVGPAENTCGQRPDRRQSAQLGDRELDVNVRRVEQAHLAVSLRADPRPFEVASAQVDPSRVEVGRDAPADH